MWLGHSLRTVGFLNREDAATIDGFWLIKQCPRESIEGWVTVPYMLNRRRKNIAEISVLLFQGSKRETEVPFGEWVRNLGGFVQCLTELITNPACIALGWHEVDFCLERETSVWPLYQKIELRIAGSRSFGFGLDDGR